MCSFILMLLMPNMLDVNRGCAEAGYYAKVTTKAFQAGLATKGGNLAGQLKMVGQPKLVDPIKKVVNPKVTKTSKRPAAELLRFQRRRRRF